MKLTTVQFLHSPVTSFHLRQTDILLGFLFTDAVRSKEERRREDEIFWPALQQAFLNVICFNFLVSTILSCFRRPQIFSLRDILFVFVTYIWACVMIMPCSL